MELDWLKILDLLERTGDKFIFNHQNDNYVIMKMNDYHQLVLAEKKEQVIEMTEDELIDKINQDIALWRQNQEQEIDLSSFQVTAETSADQLDETDDQYYLEPVE